MVNLVFCLTSGAYNIGQLENFLCMDHLHTKIEMNPISIMQKVNGHNAMACNG